MAGMTGGTGTLAAIEIHPAHTLIGPAFDDWKFQFAGVFGIPGFLADDSEPGPVTIIAGLGFGGFIGRPGCNSALASF